MSSYIPKQPKQNRDRVEAKLDRELIRMLERYCQYLDSDRDYVIGKALEIASLRLDRRGPAGAYAPCGAGPLARACVSAARFAAHTLAKPDCQEAGPDRPSTGIEHED